LIPTNSISIIVPVYHESRIINDQISHIRALPGGRDVEIMIVDGAPERDTLRSIKFDQVQKITSKKGRGVQMNTGTTKAKGDLLLFLHADTFLPGESLSLIRKTLSNEKISAGAFTLRVDKLNPILNSLIFIHDLRGIITRIPYGDQAIFIRRSVFEELGGYREFGLFEDLDLMERLRKRRYKIKILPEKVITSGRRYRKNGPFRNLIRNIILIFFYKMGVHPNRLARFYEKKRNGRNGPGQSG